MSWKYDFIIQWNADIKCLQFDFIVNQFQSWSWYSNWKQNALKITHIRTDIYKTYCGVTWPWVILHSWFLMQDFFEVIL